MHHPRRPIRLSTGTEPPTEFRLFPLGQIETTKGTFVLTPEDAAACVERHVGYGNDLSVDYGHGVFEEAEGTPQRAAGWIAGLQVRPDGLWATGVTWTDTAARMIRAREQRYFSPAFMADEDGHITEILNVALTLMPATHNLTPLVASRRSGRTATSRRTSMEDKYVDASALLKLADDIEKMGEGEDKEKADLKALAERCRKLAEGGETLAKLAEDLPPPSSKPAPEQTSSDAPADTAADDEKKEEAKAASRIVAAARDATGEKDASRIVGALKALGESQGAVVKLTARVAELEASDKAAKDQAKKDRVTSLVKVSATPGPKCNVSPAEVDDLIAQGIKDEEWLKGYLAKKPAIVAASSVVTAASNATEAAAANALTEEQKNIIKASGLSVDDFIQARAKLPA